jgi:CHAP domain
MSSRLRLTWAAAGAMVLTALVVAVGAAGAAQASRSGRVALFPESRTLERGHVMIVQASVPVGEFCRLSLGRPGGATVHSAISRARSALAQFEWKVPPNAAGGQQLVTISCASSRARIEAGRVRSDSALLSVSGRSRRARSGELRVRVAYPLSGAQPITGKGGGGYPAYGSVLIPGSGWLDGHGVTVYSDGRDGGDGYYQCVELINRLITTLHWSPTIWGNANQIYGDASNAYFVKYGNGSGYRPVPGDIVVWGGGYHGFGHVQVVNSNNGSSLTVVEQNASPSGYNVDPISSSGYVAGRNGYYVEGFLHPKADTIGQAPAPTPAPAPAPTPTTTTPTTTTTSTTTPTPTPAPTYHNETVGGVAHTWTNYSNAGGNEGPSIASNETVQIACKVTGFKVADGNTWWYRIASSPWDSNYYVSADAFYNDGATSGSLIGTPFVDPAVPNC